MPDQPTPKKARPARRALRNHEPSPVDFNPEDSLGEFLAPPRRPRFLQIAHGPRALYALDDQGNVHRYSASLFGEHGRSGWYRLVGDDHRPNLTQHEDELEEEDRIDRERTRMTALKAEYDALPEDTDTTIQCGAKRPDGSECPQKFPENFVGECPGCWLAKNESPQSGKKAPR